MRLQCFRTRAGVPDSLVRSSSVRQKLRLKQASTPMAGQDNQRLGCPYRVIVGLYLGLSLLKWNFQTPMVECGILVGDAVTCKLYLPAFCPSSSDAGGFFQSPDAAAQVDVMLSTVKCSVLTASDIFFVTVLSVVFNSLSNFTLCVLRPAKPFLSPYTFLRPFISLFSGFVSHRPPCMNEISYTLAISSAA